NIENINSKVKEIIQENVVIGPDVSAVYIGKKIKANADYIVEEIIKKQKQQD
ncbi:TPA: hypothetical protein SB147_002053, partial [Campylobacter coli]|nr:hypothetical protein [Campylobacter coli]